MKLKEHYLLGYLDPSFDKPVHEAIIENMLEQIPASALITYSGFRQSGAILPANDEWLIIYTSPELGDKQ